MILTLTLTLEVLGAGFLGLCWRQMRREERRVGR